MVPDQFKSYIKAAKGYEGVYSPKGAYEATFTEDASSVFTPGVYHRITWDMGTAVYLRGRDLASMETVQTGTMAVLEWEEISGIDLFDDYGLELLL